MFLRINERLSVDNLNDYPKNIVAQLEELLASGTAARPDPKRKNFYEVETPDRVFFIHAAPARDKVMLLATWPTVLPPAELVGTSNAGISHGSLAEPS
jgi:hypothetical protein